MQKYYSYRSWKSIIHKSWKSAHNGRYYKREVIKANEAATIHIGLAPSTVSMMAKQFKIYAVKHPEIHFDIHEGSTFTLKDQLENRVVDITTLRTPISVNGFASRTLMTDELCAMAVPQKNLEIIIFLL